MKNNGNGFGNLLRAMEVGSGMEIAEFKERKDGGAWKIEICLG